MNLDSASKNDSDEKGHSSRSPRNSPRNAVRPHSCSCPLGGGWYGSLEKPRLAGAGTVMICSKTRDYKYKLRVRESLHLDRKSFQNQLPEAKVLNSIA